MKDYTFRLDFTVRDYECDMQGVVNNAVYQNYLEHARHEYLKKVGINFKRFTEKGINLVVVRSELDYKYPLRSGDRFWAGLNLVKVSPVRFGFLQDIYMYPDDKLILNAKIIGTALNERGRPKIPVELQSLNASF